MNRGKLYLEGHNHRLGYAISEEYNGVVKYSKKGIKHLRRVIDRCNRIFRSIPATDADFSKELQNA
jgi:hypothetical protein